MESHLENNVNLLAVAGIGLASTFYYIFNKRNSGRINHHDVMSEIRDDKHKNTAKLLLKKKIIPVDIALHIVGFLPKKVEQELVPEHPRDSNQNWHGF